MIPVRISPCITRLVNAPGFTTETFRAALERSQTVATMRIEPLGRGMVRVAAASGGGCYVVSRSQCTCKGHRAHGYCRHRAQAIYAADVAGIDLRRETVLGWRDGRLVTAAEREAELAREAA